MSDAGYNCGLAITLSCFRTSMAVLVLPPVNTTLSGLISLHFTRVVYSLVNSASSCYWQPPACSSKKSHLSASICHRHLAQKGHHHAGCFLLCCPKGQKQELLPSDLLASWVWLTARWQPVQLVGLTTAQSLRLHNIPCHWISGINAGTWHWVHYCALCCISRNWHVWQYTITWQTIMVKLWCVYVKSANHMVINYIIYLQACSVGITKNWDLN